MDFQHQHYKSNQSTGSLRARLETPQTSLVLLPSLYKNFKTLNIYKNGGNCPLTNCIYILCIHILVTKSDIIRKKTGILNILFKNRKSFNNSMCNFDYSYIDYIYWFFFPKELIVNFIFKRM